jgi:hypothetical protein
MTTRGGSYAPAPGGTMSHMPSAWIEALVLLVMTFNLGIMIERLGGIGTAHRELLDWIEQWISR